MEDLVQLFDLTETYPKNLEQQTEEWLAKLRAILWGPSAAQPASKEDLKNLPAGSPQQTKKRVKRLSSLNEEESEVIPCPVNNGSQSKLSKAGNVSPIRTKRSNAELLEAAEAIDSTEKTTGEDVIPRKKSVEENEEPVIQRKSEATNLMPPPAAPVITAVATEEHQTGRPQRAARLKSEKSLKEPKLNVKIRRPTEESVKIKLEHEQRPSQMHEKTPNLTVAETSSKASINSAKSNDSVLIVPGKKQSPVEINSTSDEDEVVQPTADPEPKKNDAKEVPQETSELCVRVLRVKIKSEKLSIQPTEEKQVPSENNATFKAPEDVPPPSAGAKSKNNSFDDSSVASSTLSSTANTSSVPGKKTRKKKDAPPHRPIKVERFSDLDPKPSPVSSRTRHGSTGKSSTQHEEDSLSTQPELPVVEETKRPGSVYEDAVETPPSRHSKTAAANKTASLGTLPAADATMNLGPVPGDATFCTNPAQTTFQVAPGQTTFVMDSGNPNATVTLNKNSGAMCDATFEVHSSSKNDKDEENGVHRSFETAKDSSMPHNDSLITEDESCEPSPPLPVKQKATTVKPTTNSASAKATGSNKSSYKMPTRTNELFNPLAQSPVKMRVEAFENAAAAAATEQPKRPLRNKKENVTPTNATTPVIGKLPVPALGRFLTPTQSSNVLTTGSAFAKKVATSASKAAPFPKSASSTLQRSNSNASAKTTLHRENSADDFRKNLHNLAEERKKQREQKHLQAAQQREAKERERAERVAKLAKEKEEKRLQKQQEKMEQQKREMEEIQRKLRLQQEEEAKIKAAKEREMLMHMKQQQLQQQQMTARQRMMPPPPKSASKYTFEMLHEDDSTDDEDRVSYKRPPPPSWSRTHKRGPYVLKQEYTPSGYIDSFFSVQPMTPDLKKIFPNIDPRHLKRNSSVLWSTPPRYSELPKY